ncbi:hypothetical protein A6302_03210 [Methylobrevis pamukkalensis]|uniref:Ancillary SecYEG translocon subunit/Cell division coordinator CpoB TPR domain-containing protein n=2 Tax=Methylobrevis pamukkalensis TaxID=1439726 RepID=A0A1E3GZM0_9HYPH|nr:hypothetical protein A6302_03210 [Methylobrevis pamukkalensis]
MVDLFNEVSEELRRDRMTRFWRSYGVYVIALAVLIVVATAAWAGWDYWRIQRSEAAGARYLDAMAPAKAGDHVEATKALEAFALEAPDGYAVLARFRAASEKASAGEMDNAVGAFQILAEDGALSPELRDLARYRAALLAVDTEDFAAVKARLDPLMAEGNPFAASARELLGLAAVKAELWEDARTALAPVISDTTVPSDVQARAQILMDIVIGKVGPGAESAPAAVKEGSGS